MPDMLTFNIIELINRDTNNHLDGRILQLLAVWKVKNIQFWLQIEDLYKPKIQGEETFKLIEALVGLGMIHRGSSQFIKEIIDEVVKRRIDRLSSRDFSRFVLAISLLTNQKAPEEIFERVKL